MRFSKTILALVCLSSPLYAENNSQLERQIQQLQTQAQRLQSQLNQLQKKLGTQKQIPRNFRKPAPQRARRSSLKKTPSVYHATQLTVHAPEAHPESIRFLPTALVADNRVVTYIAGTPIVSSPYLGDRPAFDGSDYIVNISSINRDIRLMQQRRRMYRAYESIGYPAPQMPIISLSGKVEPVGVVNSGYNGTSNADFTLGTSELDVAAALNKSVEGYIAIAYGNPPVSIGPRVNNSIFNLNMAFVNIGNLDSLPFYFTAGQLYVPFGRYSSSMISAPLPLNLSRTKTRPFILGYKSQGDTGPFAAIYSYRAETTLGRSGVGGANLGYVFKLNNKDPGEIGVSFISSINDAAGMQNTASPVGTTFGGFGSILNGSEMVKKIPAVDVHAIVGFGPFNATAEWVTATQAFRVQDLSYNGQPAKPQAGSLELDGTFRSFHRPSSFGIAYQWTRQALALNLPEQRIVAVYNISIWKDTVESLEYKHDFNYGVTQYANGAAPPGLVNLNTYGTGTGADTVSAQIGVYF